MSQGGQARLRKERGLKLCPTNIQVSYEQSKIRYAVYGNCVHTFVPQSVAMFSIKSQRLNYLSGCPEIWCR
jgi:hypothetical protein